MVAITPHDPSMTGHLSVLTNREKCYSIELKQVLSRFFYNYFFGKRGRCINKPLHLKHR